MLSHFINVFFVEFILSLFPNNKRIAFEVFSIKGLNWETVAMEQYAIMSDAAL